MKRHLLLLSVFLLFFLYSAKAQSGSAYVNAGSDMYVPCNDSCITLHADYVHVGPTDVYSVSQIVYNPQPYNTGTNIGLNVDDMYEPAIAIPFPFCFYDGVYNNIVPGANGIFTFDISAQMSLCPYHLDGGYQLPTDSLGNGTKNAIMAPFQDIDPTNMGTYYYSVSGTAPNRIFKITYYHVPYYGDPNSSLSMYCPSPLFATGEVLLYETTNVIDINIETKEMCPNWNGGRAIEGIQDRYVLHSAVVPGRNNTQWTAYNDAWRFTPSGTSSAVSVTWYKSGVPIGTGDSVVVCPQSNSEYVVEATYPGCGSGNIIVRDTVKIFLPSSLTATMNYTGETCSSCNDGTVTVNVSSGNPPYSYTISPSAGILSGNIFSNLPPGDYNVCVTDSAGCIQCDSVSIGVFTDIRQVAHDNRISILPNPFYKTAKLQLNSNFGNATLKIYNTLGSLVKEQTISGQSAIINREGLENGIYFLRVSDGEHEWVGKIVVE